MHKVDRIVVSGSLSYNNCEVYAPGEKDIVNFLEDDQTFFIDELGVKYIVSNYAISYVELPKIIRQKRGVTKVTRLNIASDITFSPAWVIKPEFYDHYGIPDMFGNPLQFSFIDANDRLYITTDSNILLIQI